MESPNMIASESRYCELEQKHTDLLDRSIGLLLKYKSSLEHSPGRERSQLSQEIGTDLQCLVSLRESFQQKPWKYSDEIEAVSGIHRSLMSYLQTTKPLSSKLIQTAINNSFSEISGVFTHFSREQKLIQRRISEKWKTVLNSIEQKYNSIWKNHTLSPSKSLDTKDKLAQKLQDSDSAVQKFIKKSNRKNTAPIHSSRVLKLNDQRKLSIIDVNEETSQLKHSYGASSSTNKFDKSDKESYRSSGKATPSSIQDSKRLKHMKSEILGFCNPSSPKKKKIKRRSSKNVNNVEPLKKGMNSLSQSKFPKSNSLVSEHVFLKIQDLFEYYSSQFSRTFERVANEMENKLVKISQCLTLLIRKSCLVEYELQSLNTDHERKIQKIKKLKTKEKENLKHIDKLKAKISELRNKKESIFSESIKVYNDKNEIVKQINEQSETIRKCREEIDYLKSNEVELNQKTTHLNSELELYKTRCQESSDLEDRLKNMIKDLENTVQSQEITIQSLQEPNKVLTDTFKEQELQIKNLCKEMDIVRSDLKKTLEELSLKKEENKNLKDMTSRYTNEKNEALENNQALLEENQALLEENQAFLEKNSELKAQVDSLRTELKENNIQTSVLSNYQAQVSHEQKRQLKIKILNLVHAEMRKQKQTILEPLRKEIEVEFQSFLNSISDVSCLILEKLKENTAQSEKKISLLQQELIVLNSKLNEQMQKQKALNEFEEVITKMRKDSGISTYEDLFSNFESKGHDKTQEISGDNIPNHYVSESISGLSYASLPSEIHQLQDEIQEEQRLVYQHEQQILALKLYIIDLESALKKLTHDKNLDHFNEVLIKFMLNLPKLNTEGEDMIRVILAMQGISTEEIKSVENTRTERNLNKELGQFDSRNI